MDPLSITASAIAVAHLCSKAIALCSHLIFQKHEHQRALAALRTEIRANQFSLQTIQELLEDEEGSFATSVGRNDEWAETFKTVFGACETTISILIEELEKVTISITGGPSQIKQSLIYVWKEQDIKDLTAELRAQHNAVQTLIQTLQLKSVSEAMQMLQKEQKTFDQVKSVAESHFSTADTLDPNARAVDVFSILDSRHDGRTFDFDHEIVNSVPYRSATTAQRRPISREIASQPLPLGDLLEFDEDEPAQGRYLQELQDAFFVGGPSSPSATVDNLYKIGSRAERVESLLKDRTTSATASPTEVQMTATVFTVPARPDSFAVAIDSPKEEQSDPALSVDRETKISSSPVSRNTEPSAIAAAGLIVDTDARESNAWLTSSSRPPIDIAGLRADAPLHYAAYLGDVTMIQRLAHTTPSSHVDKLHVDARDATTFTPIMYAAMFGHVSAVKKLLELGADASIVDAMNRTACHWAVIRSHCAIVRILLGEIHNNRAHAIELTLDGRSWAIPGWCLLTLAALVGQPDLFHYVHSSGWNISSAKWPNPHFDQEPLQSASASTSYLLLIAKISQTTVQDLSKSGSRFFSLTEFSSIKKSHPELWTNCEDESNKSSAVDDRLSIITTMIEDKFKVSRQDRHGFTALQAACCGASERIVQKLLDSGAANELKHPPGSQARPSIRDILIEASPLYLAAFWNRRRIIDLLVRYGADPNISGYAQRTPLHYACAMGNVEAVNALLSAGAKVDIGACEHWKCFSTSCGCTKFHHTPLSLACSYHHWDVVDTLIKHGAQLNAKIYQLPVKNEGSFTYKGTILHRMLTTAHTSASECIELLLKAGCDPNAISDLGHTPLHTAVVFKDLATVQLLLCHGADPAIPDPNDNAFTPLHRVIAHGRADGNVAEIVECLLKFKPSLHSVKLDYKLDVSNCEIILKNIRKGKESAVWNYMHQLEDYTKVERLLQKPRRQSLPKSLSIIRRFSTDLSTSVKI